MKNILLLAAFLLAAFNPVLRAQSGVTAYGVKYTTIKAGTGANPVNGQECLMQVESLAKDGSISFSTKDMNVVWHEQLGKNTDLESRANDELIQKMQKGGVYRIEFPKKMLRATHPAKKEAGDYLVSTVELVDILDAKPSGVDLFFASIKKDGMEVAIAEAQDMQKNNPKGYTYYEWDLNAAGYKALEEKNAFMAVNIFKLSTFIYPNSWNAFDSLGDAYLANNNAAKAKASFQKALELNPKYLSSKQKLAKL